MPAKKGRSIRGVTNAAKAPHVKAAAEKRKASEQPVLETDDEPVRSGMIERRSQPCRSRIRCTGEAAHTAGPGRWPRVQSFGAPAAQ
jgi:hypothetical protein